MVDHVWSVLCGQAIVDERSNNVSLINVLETVTFVGPAPPADGDVRLPFEAELVSVWTRSDPDIAAYGQAKLLIQTPSGKQREGPLVEIDLSDQLVFKTIGVVALPFSELGLYYFIVQLQHKDEWVQVSKIPLLVHLEKEEDEPEVVSD